MNLDVDPQEWLAELFENHYCDVCGGDAVHHTAVPFCGNWFARCDFPAGEERHPVIQEFRLETAHSTTL